MTFHSIFAQAALLGEVDTVFTQADNEMLAALPSKEEIWDTLLESNLNAAPGTDGINSYVYKSCWDILGESLFEVITAVFQGESLSASQRTSMMVFGCKPKKPTSLKPSDKRRISLLNADFKISTGLQAQRFKKPTTHTLSPHQLVSGEDRRIYHGINLARDAINAASG